MKAVSQEAAFLRYAGVLREKFALNEVFALRLEKFLLCNDLRFVRILRANDVLFCKTAKCAQYSAIILIEDKFFQAAGIIWRSAGKLRTEMRGI